MRWSDERIEELRALWTKGLSASCIASQLGEVSRCAVLGKVYRLGLEQRRTTLRINAVQGRRHQVASRTMSAAANHLRGNASPARPKLRLAKRRPAPSAAELRAWEVQAGAKLIPLLELQADMCRWPIGEPKTEGFGFCGGPRVEDIAYCLRHAIVAFRPARRMPRDPPIGALRVGPCALPRDRAVTNAFREDDECRENAKGRGAEERRSACQPEERRRT